MKVYFFGELGFFSTGIWPYLELAMTKYSDLTIEIVTLPDIASLLYTIYKERAVIIKTMYTGIRDRFESKDTNVIKLLESYPEYQCLYTYIKDYLAPLMGLPPDQHPNSFRGIIPTADLLTLSKLPSVKPSILFFPRLRTKNVEHWRNISPEIFEYVMNLLRDKDFHIVGGTGETLCHTKIISGLVELIPYFNSAKMFISCDSGLVDFAKLCGCKNIVILSRKDFLPYHSFNCWGTVTQFINWSDPTILVNKLKELL